jgi:hypothetical protein
MSRRRSGFGAVESLSEDGGKRNAPKGMERGELILDGRWSPEGGGYREAPKYEGPGELVLDGRFFPKTGAVNAQGNEGERCPLEGEKKGEEEGPGTGGESDARPGVEGTAVSRGPGGCGVQEN